MSWTVDEIALALSARVLGDGTLAVTGAAEPSAAGPDDLALAMDPKYADGLSAGAARAAIVWDGADWQAMGLAAALVVPRPRYAMAGVTRLMDPGPGIAPGIHPTAHVDPTATLGPGAAIGPFAVIGPGVSIGANLRLGAHASIGEHATIGDDALIREGVRICHRVRIGHRFVANPNAVVGGDGLAFVTPEKSRVEAVRESLGADTQTREASWTRIHSLGTVEIGDDVELGACCTVDRGTIRATRVGSGTKLDNLVMVGHNVVIGRDCIAASQVGIAGSTTIGDRVVLAGQVGVNDNIRIGDDVVCGGAAKVFTNVPAGRVVLGYPAMKMDQYLQASKNWRRLPRLMEDVRALKKALSSDAPSD